MPADDDQRGPGLVGQDELVEVESPVDGAIGDKKAALELVVDHDDAAEDQEFVELNGTVAVRIRDSEVPVDRAKAETNVKRGGELRLAEASGEVEVGGDEDRIVLGTGPCRGGHAKSDER